MSVSWIISTTVMRMLIAPIPLEVTTAAVRLAMREMDSTAQVIQQSVPYSAKFSRVFNFTNFANFKPFVKLFQRKFLTRKPYRLCCRIYNEHSQKRYRRSRHCFADSCELVRGRLCRQCILDRTCLYAMPILHYVAVCALFRQRIHEIISTKSSKTAIIENLDPPKI